MKRLPNFQVIGVLALAILLAVALPVMAKDMQGTLLSIEADDNTFDLVSDEGNVTNFRFAPTGQVFINDEERTLADLNPGDDVSVTYEVENEQLVATVIRCTRN